MNGVKIEVPEELKSVVVGHDYFFVEDSDDLKL